MSEADDERMMQLVNEFLEKAQAGDQPDIDDYCGKYPEYAEELRELIDALDLLEDLNPHTTDAMPKWEVDLPSQIGDYQIICEIGRGGMGVVYEAQQESLNRRVALKVLPHSLVRTGDAKVRFQREARAAARMHHTNIVPVFEVGNEGDSFFYAMQLIRGQSLDLIIDELRRSPDLNSAAAISAVSHAVDHSSNGASSSPLVEATGHSASVTGHGGTFYRSVANIGAQAADALAYAHARGVIHRDIKPSNLMLDGDGVVWVTDFGLAKSDVEEGTLTATGDFLGTLRYMSPERFRGQCDTRADIYALGMTLYELAVKRPAFQAVDRMKLIYSINELEPERPRSIDENIPRDLETIILKAIDKNVVGRYQSAEAVAADLRRFNNDEPIEARRLTSFEQLRRWGRRNKGLAGAISGIAALLVVVVVGATWAAIQQNDLRGSAETSAELAAIAQRAAEDAKGRAESAQSEAEEALGQVEQSRRTEQLARENAEASRAQAEAMRLQVNRTSYHSEFNLAGRLLALPGGRDKIKQIVGQWRDVADNESLKGWEWHLLNESTRPDGVLVEGLNGSNAAEWSHDGKFVAVASDRRVAIVDAKTGTVVGDELVGHSGDVNDVAWHPNDTFLVSVANDSTARFWDVTTRKEVSDRRANFAGPATRIAWSASGERIAFSVDNKGLFAITSFSDPESKPQLLPGSMVFARHLSWSPDELHLAAGTWFQNVMTIYDVENQQPVDKKFRATRLVWDDAHSVIRKIHATAPGHIDVFDGSSGLRTQVLSGHTQWARTLDVSPNRSVMVSGGSDQKIHIWDLETGRIQRMFMEHSQEITSVRFSPDAKKVVSVSNDSVRIWDRTEPEKLVLDNSGDMESREAARELRVTDLAWHADGNHLAAASYDGHFRIWDVEQRRVARRYHGLSLFRCLEPGRQTSGRRDIRRVADRRPGQF